MFRLHLKIIILFYYQLNIQSVKIHEIFLFALCITLKNGYIADICNKIKP